jgi:GNAT superfamily N-acetyltransferase
MMTSEGLVSVREVGRQLWAAAAPIAARAFFDEEFVVGMHGSEPLARWVATHHFYAVEEYDPDAVHLAAFVGPVQVGMIRVSPFGRCHLCTQVSATTPPDDPILARDWAFDVAARQAHQPYPGHAWISRVAVEPQLRGTGIGGRLLDAALDRLAADGRGPVLLECLPVRVPYYASRGFRRIAEIEHPNSGGEALLMALPTDRTCT